MKLKIYYESSIYSTYNIIINICLLLVVNYLKFIVNINQSSEIYSKFIKYTTILKNINSEKSKKYPRLMEIRIFSKKIWYVKNHDEIHFFVP